MKLTKTAEDYSKMQKSVYSDPDVTAEDFVGNYAWHENFPYETNLLYRFADVRLPIFENFADKTALDIGCGPGRMVARMRKYFRQVDGVDISARLLETARKTNPSGNFYESTGADLGAAPSGHYDFVYSTIAMQHIAVNSIRKEIFKHIHRVLKPGGRFTLQFAYLDTLPFIVQRSSVLDILHLARIRRVLGHADWSENRNDASTTNGFCDVTLGPKSLPVAAAEFESIFGNVEYWFLDTRIYYRNLRGASHVDYWASHWIFFHGVKSAS